MTFQSRLACALFLAGSLGLAMPTASAQDLTIVLEEEPNQLDPCQITNRGPSFVTKNNIIESLTAVDPETSEVLPQLITEWTRLSDLTWRFALRKGVRFTDGVDFNADTFISSVERTMSTDLQCVSRLAYFGGIELTMAKVDANTVDVTTNTPQPLLPLLMSYLPANSPNTRMDGFSREPVGTGPYKLVEWQAGQRIVLARNDDYWGETPAAENVTYLFRQESTVRAAMVAQGEADIALNIANQDAGSEMDFTFLNTETVRLRFDIEKPPMDDIRVRQAIKFAVDREAFLGTVYPDTWQLATNMVLPAIVGYNPNIEHTPYDPEKAAQLIEEARSDGTPVDQEILFPVKSTDSAANQEASAVIADMLNAVGLNVRIMMVETAEMAELFQFRPFPEDQPVHLFRESHDNNTGDAGITVVAKYSSDGGVSTVHDPEIDALIATGLAEMGAERAEVFQEVFAEMDARAVDLVLFHQTAIVRVGPRVVYKPSTATNSELALKQVSFVQ